MTAQQNPVYLLQFDADKLGSLIREIQDSGGGEIHLGTDGPPTDTPGIRTVFEIDVAAVRAFLEQAQLDARLELKWFSPHTTCQGVIIHVAARA